MPGAETTILIDLGETRDARAIADERQFVHQDALKRLRELLPPLIQAAAQPATHGARGSAGRNADSEVTERRHDAIAVLGGRGSGKTTFLLSVLHALDAGKLGLVPDGRAVRSLNILDPTLVGTKECILLTIISRIKSLVEAHNRRCGRADDEAPLRDAWDRSLDTLARGLAVLDEIGTNPLTDDGWSDHNFVVETGLENVTASRLLERRFHDFLAASLDLIGASAFVIGIDDIDTAFDRGWPVLETLRRYLTSPKLIILLAGDLELFSALVRKTQWQNLGDLPSRHEPDRAEYYAGLVDRLEDQYLLKLMKPENRIFLGSIYSSYQAIGDSLVVAHNVISNDNNKNLKYIPINIYLTQLITSVLRVRRASDVEKFIRIFLEEPIRTVVQILQVCAGYRMAVAYQESVQSDGKGIPWMAPEAMAVDRLLHVFNGPLGKLGLQSNRVRSMGPHDFGPLIAQTLVNLDLLDPGYSMWPDFADSLINLGFIALGAKLSMMNAHRPSTAIQYMIKVGMTREIQVAGPTHPRSRQEHMRRYLRYADLDAVETVLGTARRATAFLRSKAGTVATETTRFGTIALYGDVRPRHPLFLMYGVDVWNSSQITTDDAPDQLRALFDHSQSSRENASMFRGYGQREGDLGAFYNTPNSLENSISGIEERGLVTLPLQLVVDGQGVATPILSVFNLIAMVAEFLNCRSEHEFRDRLRACAQIRSYPVPAAADEHLPGSASIDVGLEMYQENRSWKYDPAPLLGHDFSELPIILLAWVNHASNSFANSLPIHAFSRMWTRFYYTLDRCDAAFVAGDAVAYHRSVENWPEVETVELDEELGEPSKLHPTPIAEARSLCTYAGDALHRFLVAFFNAVLVEEAIFSDTGEILNLTNPSSGDDIFVENLKKWLDNFDAKQGDFFTVIFSFPLWSFYLDPDSDVFRMQKQVMERLGMAMDTEVTYLVNGVTVPNLHPLLNTLLVHRPAHLSVPHDPSEAAG